MPELKNQRHERFVLGLLAGKTADEAYEQAGYVRNRKNAARLKANEDILTRLRELQTEVAEEALVTKSWIIRKLRENVERCLDGEPEEINPNAGNRALELLGKEIGMFVDRKSVDQQVTHQFDALTAERRLHLLGQVLNQAPIAGTLEVIDAETVGDAGSTPDERDEGDNLDTAGKANGSTPVKGR